MPFFTHSSSQLLAVLLVMHCAILLGTPEVASAQQSKAKMDPIRELQVKRVEKLGLLHKQRFHRYQVGEISYEMMAPTIKWLLDAELELCETKAERVATHEKLIKLAEEMLAVAEQRHKAGAGSGDDLTYAEVQLLETQIGLARAKSD